MERGAQVLKLPYGRNTLFSKLRADGVLKESRIRSTGLFQGSGIYRRFRQDNGGYKGNGH
jgi:hypothetical protein